jgi:hypothetical protein
MKYSDLIEYVREEICSDPDIIQRMGERCALLPDFGGWEFSFEYLLKLYSNKYPEGRKLYRTYMMMLYDRYHNTRFRLETPLGVWDGLLCQFSLEEEGLVLSHPDTKFTFLLKAEEILDKWELTPSKKTFTYIG